MLAGSARAGKCFQSDIPVFNLHGRSNVNLDADHAFGCPVRGIVVDGHAHDLPVYRVN